MIYGHPPDSDWRIAPEQGNKDIQGRGDAHISELSHPFSHSLLFICVRLNV